MRTKSVQVLMAALVVLAVSFGCSGSDGGVKSPTSPGVPTPTVSLSGLSVQAQAIVLRYSLSSHEIQRWQNGGIRVARGSFSVEDVKAAVSNWEWLPVNFVVVDGEVGDIVLHHSVPTSSTSDACGSGAPIGSPQFTGGKIEIGIGLKAGCDGGLRLLIAHEIGHALGFLDMEEGLMKSEVSSFDIPSYLREAALFIQGAEIGAKVVVN